MAAKPKARPKLKEPSDQEVRTALTRVLGRRALVAVLSDPDVTLPVFEAEPRAGDVLHESFTEVALLDNLRVTVSVDFKRKMPVVTLLMESGPEGSPTHAAAARFRYSTLTDRMARTR